MGVFLNGKYYQKEVIGAGTDEICRFKSPRNVLVPIFPMDYFHIMMKHIGCLESSFVIILSLSVQEPTVERNRITALEGL